MKSAVWAGESIDRFIPPQLRNTFYKGYPYRQGRNNGIGPYDFPVNGLVGYFPLWALKDGSFRSVDAFKHTCSVTGATWGLQGRTFDSIDDLINCGSNAILDDLGASSFVFWINPTSLGELNAGRLIHKRTVTDDVAGLIISLTNDAPTATLYFARDYVTTDLFVVAADSVITLGQWQMATVTWDGSTTATNVHIYINDSEVTYQTQTDGVGNLVSDAAYDLIIGNTPAGARTYHGTIGEVLVYKNHILTAGEVKQIYNSTRWRYL